MTVEPAGGATGSKVPFLITVDAEGDNGWSRPRTATTRNARYVPRFQEVCDRYGLKPTYLTNYEMAGDPFFVEFARDAVSRGTAEVGMHLHAWNTPPLDVTLTESDYRHVPFLVEYPPDVMRRKVQHMTRVIEDTFGQRPTSHRAGRWAIDPEYVKILIDEGYGVDCSVTPHVNWRPHQGAHAEGPDYRRFPAGPYFMDPDRIDRPGESPLLQVPLTVQTRAAVVSDRIPTVLQRFRYSRAVVSRVLPTTPLRPRGRNRRRMVEMVREAVDRGSTHVEFMIHSSELMPGASPTFPTNESIEALYEDLDAIFESAASGCTGMTLAEFREHHVGVPG